MTQFSGLGRGIADASANFPSLGGLSEIMRAVVQRPKPWWRFW